ncbi:MAG: flagellar hook-basal body protein [Dethiobacteria bacterium]|jgi:flagellar basal-body rod protein FlgG
MLKSISNSSSALQGYQHMLATTAHNLSNVNTVAYRERKVSFHDLPYRPLMERRLPRTENARNTPFSGRGMAISSITTSLEKGAPLATGKQFDLNILGEGFFRVIRPDGSYAYTRSGNFYLNEQGNLSLPGGALLDPFLQLTALEEEADLSHISITAEGIVYAPSLKDILEEVGEEETLPLEEMDGEMPAGMLKLGEIHLYHFINSQGLYSIGENLFLPTEASGLPIEAKPGEEGLGKLQQGFLEGSNVELTRQMTNLIRGQRFLQASARALTTGDELWAITLNMLA